MTITSQSVDADGGVTSITQERNKVTVSFQRKVNLGNFESADASAFVEADVAIGADDAAKTVAATAAAAIAKSVVYETLGIGMTVSGGAIAEAKNTLQAAFGEVETVAVTPARAASKPNAAGSPAAGLTGSAAKKALWEDLQANPSGWEDKRKYKASGANKPTSPDFKRIGSDDALWMEYKGTSTVPAGIVIPDVGFGTAPRKTA